MPRIISGSAKGSHLTVPKSGTRPTSDRVRESVFSCLEQEFDWPGLAVLDLYAGSGSLGLEAISRGAASLTSVESARVACQAIQKNFETVQKTRPDAKLQMQTRKVESFLLTATQKWSLVFIDPPYSIGAEKLVGVLDQTLNVLHRTGLIVFEQATRQAFPLDKIAARPVSEKKYGDTTVYFLEHPPINTVIT